MSPRSWNASLSRLARFAVIATIGTVDCFPDYDEESGHHFVTASPTRGRSEYGNEQAQVRKATTAGARRRSCGARYTATEVRQSVRRNSTAVATRMTARARASAPLLAVMVTSLGHRRRSLAHGTSGKSPYEIATGHEID